MRPRVLPLQGLAPCLVAAAIAFGAGSPSFNFTGHWTGRFEPSVPGSGVIDGDLASVGASKFAGMMSVSREAGMPLTCKARGKLKPQLERVKVRLRCDDGSKIILVGSLDVTSNTITGTFARSKHGKQKLQRMFALMKSPA